MTEKHIGCLDGSTIGISRRGDDIVLSIEGTKARLSLDGVRKLVNHLTPMITRVKQPVERVLPPGEECSTWSDRANHYLDNGPIYRERYKVEKMSIVRRWISYALHHNLNPGVRNKDAVDEFLRINHYSIATLGSYNRHLEEWFSMCRQFGWGT